MTQPLIRGCELAEACDCDVIIFGATGDWAKRLGFPNLFQMFKTGKLAPTSRIIGVAPKEYAPKSEEEFRTSALSMIETKGAELEEFRKRIFYRSADFKDAASMKALREFVEASPVHLEPVERPPQTNNEAAAERRTQRRLTMAHLATPPQLFIPALKALNAAGFMRRNMIVNVEKPAGRNPVEACELSKAIAENKGDARVYLFDHYAAKWAALAIMKVRRLPAMQSAWSKANIDSLRVEAREEIPVLEGRGQFFEGVGAFGDMSGHTMRWLGNLTMELPPDDQVGGEDENSVRVFRQIRKLSPDEVKRHLVLGQYEGYTKLKTVAPNSKQNTYFKADVFIDNPRWQDVSITLESGKALEAKRTYATVHFKSLTPELLTLAREKDATIPDSTSQAATLTFSAKDPRGEVTLQVGERSLSLTEDVLKTLPPAEPYVTDFSAVLGADRHNDSPLVTPEENQSGLEALEPYRLMLDKLPLHSYAAGSKGPGL